MEGKCLQRMKGRVINQGRAKGKAMVSMVPFSFIGDFDPESGKIAIEESNLYQETIKDKILVCPTGKGGTIAPFIAYLAKQNSSLPQAIICTTAEPLIAESAIVAGIPILDSLPVDPVKQFTNGQEIEINEDGEVLFTV